MNFIFLIQCFNNIQFDREGSYKPQYQNSYLLVNLEAIAQNKFEHYRLKIFYIKFQSITVITYNNINSITYFRSSHTRALKGVLMAVEKITF